MKSTKILLILTVFILSCSGNYEQHYIDFESFNKTNLRNKSWFPKIIDSTAYDLRSVSGLETLAGFGSFKYSKAESYDSIFKDIGNEIKFSVFASNVSKHKEKIPSWFLKVKEADTNKLETIKTDRFYITRCKQKKQVYFILTN